MRSILLDVFAAIALGLSAVGIYGVVSYTVAQRTNEIGIRAALGASSGNLLGLVLRGGMWMMLVGLLLILIVVFAPRGLIEPVLVLVRRTAGKGRPS